MLTESEQDLLWKAVEHLAQENKSEQASVLLKANFERTLAVVGHNTGGP